MIAGALLDLTLELGIGEELSQIHQFTRRHQPYAFVRQFISASLGADDVLPVHFDDLMANQGIQAGFVFNAIVVELLFDVLGRNGCIFLIAAEMYNTAKETMSGAICFLVGIGWLVLQLLDQLKANARIGDLRRWHLVLLVGSFRIWLVFGGVLPVRIWCSCQTTDRTVICIRFRCQLQKAPHPKLPRV